MVSRFAYMFHVLNKTRMDSEDVLFMCLGYLEALEGVGLRDRDSSKLARRNHHAQWHG